MAKADLTREVVNEALGDIPPRLRMVLALRFGLIDDRPRTLEETGRELGVTRERVRQLEKQALTQLRGSSRLEKEEELSRVRQMILAARRTTANRR